jgi:hypothetical protein
MKPDLAIARTKKIRLTRSILLNGEHTGAGTVVEISAATAADLIALDCAKVHRTIPRWLLVFVACVGALIALSMALGWW